MTIKELCKEAHATACEKGFWGKTTEYQGEDTIWTLIPRNLSELLMLVVTELGEACEALRKNKRQLCTGLISTRPWEKDTFEDELADAVIRIADLAESQGVDLEWQIQKKMEYNKTREAKHGKAF